MIHNVAVNRREVLQAAGLALAVGLGAQPARPQTRRSKKVVVAGAGIAGLSCAYELMKRGHEVTVLEAAGRTGGHIYTIRDSLSDGLYADAGAEHITKPGYDQFWQYIDELNLTALYYPRRENVIRFIDGTKHTEEMLKDAKVLAKLGFNQREIDFLARHEWWELPLVYFKPYLDNFEDEYNPFNAGLNELDQISLADLLKKDGASAAAIRFIPHASASALRELWEAAILTMRGVPLWPPKVYRLKGGNQTITDAFTEKLGGRVRLGSPITGIEHGPSGVTVHYQEFGQDKKADADHVVCAMSCLLLQRLRVTPGWPEAKVYAIHNMPYYYQMRGIFQSRSRFWERDGLSPNVDYSGESTLSQSWPMAEEIDTPRGIVLCNSAATVQPQAALATFRKYYQGKSESIEHAIGKDWSADPWAPGCERIAYRVGELAKFWPVVIEPFGRIQFVGAYADNLHWGMEAATRSANRVAGQIDQAA